MQRRIGITDTIGMLRRSLCAFSVALLVALSAIAQPNGGGPGPVLGIVEVPEMFVIDENTGRSGQSAALTLYARPADDSKVAFVIESPDAIDAAEHGYEEPGALVYGRDGRYFLIRTSRGVAWLSPRDAGAFHSLEALLTKGLTYLTDAWDGFLNASPASAERTRVPQRRTYGDEAVKVKRIQTIGGRLWLELDVLTASVCESDTAPAIKAQGWVAAHDTVGAPVVWFYSRGC